MGALAVAALSTIWISPLFDPDEGYYPATAAESLDTGHPLDPQFNGEVRWDKPILTYALIETSFAAFGRTPAAARVPSVLEGVLLILVVGAFVERLAGARAGGLAAAILSTTVGVQVFTRIAHPEMGIVLVITTAELLAVLWLTSSDRRQRVVLAVAAGVLLGVGILIKGPVALALPALAIGTASLLLFGLRRPPVHAVRDLVSCGAAAMAVALPWYVTMTLHYGVTFLREAVWRQNVGRFAGDAFVHRSSPWFFVLPTLIAMLPWSAFIPAVLFRRIRRSLAPVDVLRVSMTAAFATAFLFYSLSGSKLPHYSLAFLPPLAILIALRLDEREAPLDLRATLRATTVALAVAAAALIVLPFLVNRIIAARELLTGLVDRQSDVTWTFAEALWLPACLLAATAVAVSTLRASTAIRVLTAAGAVVPTILVLGAQPLLARAYPWDRFGPAIQHSTVPVWLIGPRAPSLTFYAGRRVVRLSEREADRHAFPASDALIVANTNWLSHRMTMLADAGRLQAIESFGDMTLARWHGQLPAKASGSK